MNSTDVRDNMFLTGEAVGQLNFISDSPEHHFRMHHQQGLRSHVIEVLSAEDVLKETRGHIVDGIRWFPRAVPRYMLRILRNRFTSHEQALAEVKKYTVVLEFLGPALIARSNEFIVEYTGTGKSEILLCGLQEYVDGSILDPWCLFGESPLERFYQSKFPGDSPGKDAVSRALGSIANFVCRTRKMFMETGHIPDLAGNGNLILTPDGAIKLVDINNIIRVDKNDAIFLDDKGYPSCDKSIEVLAILEQKFLKNEILPDDPLYGHFLCPDRKKRVGMFEEEFYQSICSSCR